MQIVITVTVASGVVVIVIAVGVSIIAYRCVRCESQKRYLTNIFFLIIYVSLSASVNDYLVGGVA